MNLLACTRKSQSVFLLLLLMAFALAGPVMAKEAVSNKQWKKWVGKKVNVTYACCGESACVQIQEAMLKEVAEKHIVVITKGSPLLLPAHMIKAVTLSK